MYTWAHHVARFRLLGTRKSQNIWSKKELLTRAHYDQEFTLQVYPNARNMDAQQVVSVRNCTQKTRIEYHGPTSSLKCAPKSQYYVI